MSVRAALRSWCWKAVSVSATSLTTSGGKLPELLVRFKLCSVLGLNIHSARISAATTTTTPAATTKALRVALASKDGGAKPLGLEAAASLAPRASASGVGWRGRRAAYAAGVAAERDGVGAGAGRDGAAAGAGECDTTGAVRTAVTRVGVCS